MSTDAERVVRVIAFELGMDKKVKLSHEFVADLDADDLDRIEVLMGIEDEFKIEIPDAEFNKCVSVGDVVALVQRYLV